MADRGGSAVALVVLALAAAGVTCLYATTWTVTCLLASSAAVLASLCRGGLRERDAAAVQRVCVLVLGDIGRSPRMQYHALSLSRRGYHVTFVGFVGSKPHGDVLREARIRIVPIAEVKGVQVGPKILTYVMKVVLQVLQLLYVLLRMKLHSHILMQNPPGLPTIAVAWLVCFLRGSRLIIDWHNYGYTIMALSLGPSHPLVRVAKWYEHIFGRLATHNLCVTCAMKDDLQRNWGIKATTLYDRPASIFRETPLKVQHELFMKLANTYPAFQRHRCEDEDCEEEGTIFSVRDLTDDVVTLRADRPALLLSSTSWTEDEDFSILLEALQEYEGFIKGGASLPSLLCVITGKGPQQAYYLKLIASLHLQHVKVETLWLEAEDYPVLLGSADLGVCLHKSSSGLDLPMKVVDMFGCCLPVCAVHFNWGSTAGGARRKRATLLQELVKHEHNGLVFRDAHQLAEQLKSLLTGFPCSDGRLGLFRRNLRASRSQRWDDNWDQHVLPVITGS